MLLLDRSMPPRGNDYDDDDDNDDNVICSNFSLRLGFTVIAVAVLCISVCVCVCVSVSGCKCEGSLPQMGPLWGSGPACAHQRKHPEMIRRSRSSGNNLYQRQRSGKRVPEFVRDCQCPPVTPLGGCHAARNHFARFLPVWYAH